MTVTDPTGSQDAQVWARAFMERFRVDEDGANAEPIEEVDLLGWFANALSAGESHGVRQGMREVVIRMLAEELTRSFPLVGIVQMRFDVAWDLVSEMLDKAIAEHGVGRPGTE